MQTTRLEQRPSFITAELRPVVVLLAAAGAALALAAPAPAAPVIGFGEQNARVFESRPWAQLRARDVRYVAGWDALESRWQREEMDAYMAAAENAGARVLLGFGRSRIQSRRRVLPSPRQFRREFRRFRARYPFITQYFTWNEANHCSQPTCRRPDAAARYYDILKTDCPECTVVGPSVLDKRDMPEWVRAVERTTKHPITTWAIHNYIDANRFRTHGTQALLRATKANVWFTETGGLVRRDNGSTIEFAESPGHAVRATKWVFKLARLSPRVKRIYFYHWISPPPHSTWDSALVDARDRPRPAYRVVRDYLRRSRAAQRAGR